LRGQRGDDGQLSGVYGQLVDGCPWLPVVCRFCVKTRPDSMETRTMGEANRPWNERHRVDDVTGQTSDCR